MEPQIKCLQSYSRDIRHVQQQGQIHQAMGFNPSFQPAGFSKFSPGFPSQFQYRIAAFTSSGSLV